MDCLTNTGRAFPAAGNGNYLPGQSVIELYKGEKAMKKIALAVILIFTIVLSACAPKAASTGSSNRNLTVSEAPAAMPAIAGASSSDYQKGADLQAIQPSNAVEQIVIKNANLSIMVLKADDTVQKISALAVKYGGFLVNSNIYKTVNGNNIEITQGSITIRVLASNLDAALAEIRAMTPDPKTDVTSENVTGEDVTATVVDLESQLKNYQAAATKLNQLMDSATTTKDALDVFNQLTSIQQQVEILQGQIKYYRDSAKLSAISVSITEKATIAPVTTEGWQPLKILRDAAQALVKFLQGLANVLIFIIVFFGPFILIAFVIIWLVWRSHKKNGWTRKGLRWIRPQPTPPPFDQKK